MSQLLSDFRYAARMLLRAPMFALTAILTLGLGLGANTAIFSFLNAFLKPLPVPRAERLVVIASTNPRDANTTRYEVSYPMLQDLRTQTRSFSDVLAFTTGIGGLTFENTTTQFLYQAVTGNYFSGLGVRPAAGRLFDRGEGETPSGVGTIVLSHRFWQTRLGGRPDIVGKIVRLNGGAMQVIGVTPEGFHGLYQNVDMEGYVTLSNHATRNGNPEFFSSRGWRALTIVGRLKPGIDIPEAQREVDAVVGRLALEYPATDRGIRLRVLPEPYARPVPIPFLTRLVPRVRASLLGLAGLVLLIACLNVGNLLLVRGAARQREMAVRTAVGASRTQLVRLLLAESLLLAMAATVAGLVLARVAAWAITKSIHVAMQLPLNLAITFDWRVFSYAAAVALLTGLVTGLVPAWRTSGGPVGTMLRDGGVGASARGTGRFRSAQVTLQVAGSLVLLVVAGLVVRSLQRAQATGLGYDVESLVSVRMDTRHVGYSWGRGFVYYFKLKTRLKDVPGVTAVSSSFSVPMGFVTATCPVTDPQRPPAPNDRPRDIGCNYVDDDYLATMGIPVVKGRGFGKDDLDDEGGSAIINETLAETLWPGENPVGRKIIARRAEGLREIVGVVRDAKYLAVFESPLPYVYLPMHPSPPSMRQVQIRIAGAPEAAIPSIARAIAEVDPAMPYADLTPMRDVVEGGAGFALVRFGALQATAMGLLGLLLATIGVYGVVSYTASQRTREMAIRLAVGAEPSAIRGLVLKQGAVMVIAGLAVGLVGALAMTRALQSLIVFVSLGDPVTFLGVTALLATTTLVATYLPARRAMKVQPAEVLRSD